MNRALELVIVVLIIGLFTWSGYLAGRGDILELNKNMPDALKGKISQYEYVSDTRVYKFRLEDQDYYTWRKDGRTVAVPTTNEVTTTNH